MPTSPVQRTTTTVGIVGGGPAGLMLSHLLGRSGIDSVVVDDRSRLEIQQTIRAGILERDSVRLLVDSGVSNRVLHEGDEHEGIELAFGGEGHRIDFADLVGASVWLYPQTDVFADLATARERDSGDVRFGVSETAVVDLDTSRPGLTFVDTDGRRHEIRCDFLVGADGSHSMCRGQIPQTAYREYSKVYPFAWFGIICSAPKSAPELIYNHSERGFALISRRTESVQRMYFQCDPDEDVQAWSEDRIWTELQARVGANGHRLKEGPITEKTVLRFRSFVHEPMQLRPPTARRRRRSYRPADRAKGLNLALADVRVLADAVERAVRTKSDEPLAHYTDVALARVWKAQHFSYWMTTMLHRLPDESDFDVQRQRAELASVVGSRAASTFLAEGYTGWPT